MIDDNENDKWVLDLPLTKQGNSVGVSIPKKIVKSLDLKFGDKVRVTLTKKGSE